MLFQLPLFRRMTAQASDTLRSFFTVPYGLETPWLHQPGVCGRIRGESRETRGQDLHAQNGGARNGLLRHLPGP